MAQYDNWYKQVKRFFFFLKKWQCENLKLVTKNHQERGGEESVQYNLDNLFFCPYL